MSLARSLQVTGRGNNLESWFPGCTLWPPIPAWSNTGTCHSSFPPPMTLSWAGRDPSPLASPGWKSISHPLLKTSFLQEEEAQYAYRRAQFTPAPRDDVDARCSSILPWSDALSTEQAEGHNPHSSVPLTTHPSWEVSHLQTQRFPGLPFAIHTRLKFTYPVFFSNYGK